jgi:hypothetical protein
VDVVGVVWSRGLRLFLWMGIHFEVFTWTIDGAVAYEYWAREWRGIEGRKEERR